jgi:hypothetical protein
MRQILIYVGMYMLMMKIGKEGRYIQAEIWSCVYEGKYTLLNVP